MFNWRRYYQATEMLELYLCYQISCQSQIKSIVSIIPVQFFFSSGTSLGHPLIKYLNVTYIDLCLLLKPINFTKRSNCDK